MDFILEQSGKLVALEIKTGSTVTSSDAAGIRAFRDLLKKKQSLVRSVVLHAGQGRPLDADILALPWSWMVAAAWLKRELSAAKGSAKLVNDWSI